MAVIPGVALSELWNGISYGEQVLKVVALFVVIVGLVGMLMALYTSLNERRREIAILRAVGVGPLKVMFLLVLESGLLALVGSLLGIGTCLRLSRGAAAAHRSTVRTVSTRQGSYRHRAFLRGRCSYCGFGRRSHPGMEGLSQRAVGRVECAGIGNLPNDAIATFGSSDFALVDLCTESVCEASVNVSRRSFWFFY